MWHKKIVKTFLPENEICQLPLKTANYPSSKDHHKSISDIYFKLRMQVCIICLNVIVKSRVYFNQR